MNLQTAWARSFAAYRHPAARKAERLSLSGIRQAGRGKVFDLIGACHYRDAERIARMLHDGLRVPVSLVIRKAPGAEAIRTYCDEQTQCHDEALEKQQDGEGSSIHG